MRPSPDHTNTGAEPVDTARIDTTDVLPDSELRRLLRDMQSKFGWADSLPEFEDIEVWESRTSFLYKVTAPGAEPAVLKVGKDWSVEKAVEVHSDLTRLDELFHATDETSLRVPRVLGWHDSPPCVCFAYVEGEDLSKRLSRREWYLSPEVTQAMADAGAALGSFHNSNMVDPGDPAVGIDMDVIRARLEAMAKKVLLGPALVDVDLTGMISRRYGDFAPYNIRMGADGSLYLLDQPSMLSFAPVHRDVVYFMYRVERRLGRYETGREDEMREVQDRLEQTFLDAYSRTGPASLSSPGDRTLFAVYLSHKHLRTARKRFRQRRIVEVPGYLRMSVQWRQRARALAAERDSR